MYINDFVYKILLPLVYLDINTSKKEVLYQRPSQLHSPVICSSRQGKEKIPKEQTQVTKQTS